MKRWLATVTYRSSAGLIPVEYEIEELDELHDLVERGPDCNSIVDIRIVLARKLYVALVDDEEAGR
jgi:hypothetical protein